MARTVLETIRAFCARQGIPRPSVVVSSTDPQVLQILGLLEEFCEDLLQHSAWEVNTIEAVWSSVAAEDQGALTSLFPLGYRGLVADTFFDRTQKLPIPVSIPEAEWAARKARGITGPLYNARIRGGRLLITPAPPAGHTLAVEYKSSYFLDTTDPATSITTQVRYPFRDSDTFRVDEALPTAYLTWAWKSRKGLEYAEDFAAYESMLLREISATKPQLVLDAGESTASPTPGIFVSPGSWPL